MHKLCKMNMRKGLYSSCPTVTFCSTIKNEQNSASLI